VIRQRTQELDEWHRRMVQALRQIHLQRMSALETAYHRLQVLGHENVLRRGFALVWRERDQKLVSAAGDVAKEDKVRIQFARDAVRAQIEEKIEGRTT
jgi:exonuclease VII large subunit